MLIILELRSNQVKLLQKNHQFLCLAVTKNFTSIVFIGNARKEHPAIPKDDLLWLFHFINDENVPFENAIYILRRKLFPFSHDPYPWVSTFL